MKNTSNYIKLLTGVTAISFSPLAVKLVTFSPTVSAFYRAFYAASLFLIISLFRYRRKKGPGHYRWLLPSVVAGVFLGIDLTVWHKTIIFLGAGPATFLGNSQVIFVALFAALIFREKIPAIYYIAVAMVLTGLYLLTPAAMVSVGRWKGYVMGLTVGFTYAGMLISLRYAKELSAGEYPELLSLGAIFSVAASVIALYAAAFEHSSLLVWDGRSHAIMMATAFMCQTLGWYLITSGITEIPAHEGSLLLLLQPLLATLWGCLFFLEPLGLPEVFGIALTLGGITAYQLRHAARTSTPGLGFEE